MHIGLWKYRANITAETTVIPTTYYRGYVEAYFTNRKMQYPCDRVWTNRKDALDDARKLLKIINH